MICKFLSGSDAVLVEEVEEEEEEEDACIDTTLVSVVVVAVIVLAVVGWGNKEGSDGVGDCAAAVDPDEVLVTEVMLLVLLSETGTGIGTAGMFPVPPPTTAIDIFEWKEDEDNVGDGARPTDALTGTRVVVGLLKTVSWLPRSDPVEINKAALVGATPDVDDDDEVARETLATAVDIASIRVVVVVPVVDGLSDVAPKNKDAPVPVTIPQQWMEIRTRLCYSKTMVYAVYVGYNEGEQSIPYLSYVVLPWSLCLLNHFYHSYLRLHFLC